MVLVSKFEIGLELKNPSQSCGIYLFPIQKPSTLPKIEPPLNLVRIEGFRTDQTRRPSLRIDAGHQRYVERLVRGILSRFVHEEL